MSTLRTKIVRRLKRLALRQVVRVDRALAGRKKGIPSRVPKNPVLVHAIERRKTYLSQKRKTVTSYRPKRTGTSGKITGASRHSPLAGGLRLRP